MKLLTILIFLFSLNLYATIIPIAAHYDGVGSIYGLGYQYKSEKNQIIFGGTAGDVDAYGLLYTRFLTQNFEISFGHTGFNNVSLLTTYNRELIDDEDELYLLNISGSANAIGSKLWLLNDHFVFNLSGTQSVVKFDDFKTDDEEIISLPNANLFDVTTTQLKYGFNLNFFDNNRSPQNGFGLSFSSTNISGRKGQSDQVILDYGTDILIPMGPIFTFGVNAKFSDSIVKVNEKYDTDTEVRAALDADCASLSSTEERTKCENLEEELINFILQNNLKGTAKPIGGSNGLRSFREQRFKAAHTAIYSAHFKTNLSSLFNLQQSENSRLEFVLFYDLGFAKEDKLELFDESKFSNGASISYILNSNAIRLTAASGSDESNSWSLTFGSSL